MKVIIKNSFNWNPPFSYHVVWRRTEPYRRVIKGNNVKSRCIGGDNE